MAFDAHISRLDLLLNNNPFPLPSTRAHVAGEWDVTERTLERLLSEVRAKRNSSLPAISRLSLDVLMIIFDEVAKR